jgi:type VI secretion system protein ImpE
MRNADDLLRAGDLDGARQALVERVKRAPDDQPSRMFLFQLFCILGEWDKAKAQLKVLTQLSPEAQMLAVAYNLAIDAELQREKAFAGELPPGAAGQHQPLGGRSRRRPRRWPAGAS